MATFIWLFVIYLVCVSAYSVIARYTIYKNDEYIETLAIVKEGLVDFGKIFLVFAAILGIIIGINYLKVII